MNIFPLPVSYCQDDEYLIKEFNEHKAPVVSLSFSPDGHYMMSGGEDKLLAIWNMETLEADFKYNDNYYPPRAIEVTQVNNIFFGSGPDIKLIDLNNNTLAVFKGNTTHIWSVDYAPEQHKVAAGSFDNSIKVWDCVTQKIDFVLYGHKKSALPVAFSPNEKHIVSGSLDRTVKIWNAMTGELLTSLEKHTDNIYDIEFHPSGKYFATCSRDMTIRLWDFETGEVVKTFVGHDKGVMDIEFTPDGNHIVSASLDGTIRLWILKSGKTIYTFTDHKGAVNCIAISRDGNFLASGGADNKVFLWKLDKKIFVEYAFPDEFNAEKNKSDIFKPRQKGEKNQDYEARLLEAKELQKQIIEKYYQQYIETLKDQTYK
jgi:WD40 repeat protein